MFHITWHLTGCRRWMKSFNNITPEKSKLEKGPSNEHASGNANVIRPHVVAVTFTLPSSLPACVKIGRWRNFPAVNTCALMNKGTIRAVHASVIMWVKETIILRFWSSQFRGTGRDGTDWKTWAGGVLWDETAQHVCVCVRFASFSAFCCLNCVARLNRFQIQVFLLSTRECHTARRWSERQLAETPTIVKLSYWSDY